MRLKKYLNELALKKAQVETWSHRDRFTANISVEHESGNVEIFRFVADIEESLKDMVLNTAQFELSPEKMMEILDKNVPDWKENILLQGDILEAAYEWKGFAYNELKKINVEGLWEIIFEDEKGRLDIVHKGKAALQVFAGVEESFKLFIRKYNPVMFTYSAHTSEKSRVKLYELLARRIKKAGYVEKMPSVLFSLSERLGQSSVKTWGFVKKDKLKVIEKVFGEE
jgi:hypothetical protein